MRAGKYVALADGTESIKYKWPGSGDHLHSYICVLKYINNSARSTYFPAPRPPSSRRYRGGPITLLLFFTGPFPRRTASRSPKKLRGPCNALISTLPCTFEERKTKKLLKIRLLFFPRQYRPSRQRHGSVAYQGNGVLRCQHMVG